MTDETISQEIAGPTCPVCQQAGYLEILPGVWAIARTPESSRARYLCHRCDSIIQVTHTPGRSDITTIIRPGRI